MRQYILNEQEYKALDEFLTITFAYDCGYQIGQTNFHGDFGVFNNDEECVSLKRFLDETFIQGYQECASSEVIEILNKLYNKLEYESIVPSYEQYQVWCKIKDNNIKLSDLHMIHKDKEMLLSCVLNDFKELENVPKCLRDEIGINALKAIYNIFSENEKEYYSNKDYIKYIKEFGKNLGLIDSIVETSKNDYSIINASKEIKTCYWSEYTPITHITEDYIRMIQLQQEINIKDVHNTMDMIELFNKNKYIFVDDVVRNNSKYIFDGELELNDDCIIGYLITTDELVEMVIKQGLEDPNNEMENINFYVDFNIENNNIKLIYSYYMMDEYYSGELEASSDEQELIIEIMRDYCEKTYSQSLLLMYTEFNNETEINCINRV